MIPLSLTLQGLYSYQERQTIDFTRLTQAHLFGIFGTVGSGKSTILEAITFALYGEIERLNKKDDKNYNMMNLKSNELFIELIFKAGPNDDTYMATVKGRRNSKKFYDVPTLKRDAYTWIDEAWKPIEVEQLETIIGLKYDNFKRTVIIPQGRFQEFLQLGNTDRTKMMKELFNLDRFELAGKVAILDSKNNRRLEHLNGRLQELAEAQEGQLETLETALENLKQSINDLTAQHTTLKRQEEALRALKTLTEKIKVAQQTVDSFQAQEPDINRMESRLQAYEYCLIHFKPGLDMAKALEAKETAFVNSLQTDEATRNRLQSQLSDVTTAFDSAKKAYENRDALKQQADDLATIAHIRQQSEKAGQLSGRIEAGNKQLEATLQQIAALTEAQIVATATLKKQREALPDIKRLMEAKSWFEEEAKLVTAGNSLQKEHQDIDQALQAVDKQRVMKLQEAGIDHLDASSTLTVLLDKLGLHKKSLLQETDTVLEQQRHVMVQSKLEDYAANLSEGQPCPLCGSQSHPAPLNAQHVSEALDALQHQLERLKTAIGQVDQLDKACRELQATRRLQEDQLKKVTEKQREHETAVLGHKDRFHWEEYPNKAVVDAALASYDVLQKQVRENETALETLTRQLDETTKQKDRYASALEGFRNEAAGLQAAIKTLTAQLKRLVLADYEAQSLTELEKKRIDVLAEYKAVESTYQRTQETLNTLQQQLNTLKGRMEANAQQLEQERTALQQTRASLQAALEQSDYPSLVEIKDILSQELDLKAGRKQCADFRADMEGAQKSLTGLLTELDDRQFSEEAYQQVVETFQGVSENLTNKHKEQGELEGKLKTIKAKLDTRKEVEEEAAHLRNRAEDLATLKNLFRSSGFVNYISTVYLQELCSAATERFYKLTRQRLSLEITDDNNFQVRDFINGGNVRSVKTLSGGQTFQAALSLALALSDSIQQRAAANQHFFFLDEGFGSLDKESLDIVFEALKSLRKENRIVGVISHVEEMQQEIDTHLRITNDEERGSLIATSW
ncbi:MAG: SMC family ATPase [Bacteroidales bacterium]|nr:SMC family ATPase [Bacteroidales bacterium]